MGKKTKYFEFKTSRDNYFKKLKKKKKTILSTSKMYSPHRLKRVYSITWWEKPKRKGRKK